MPSSYVQRFDTIEIHSSDYLAAYADSGDASFLRIASVLASWEQDARDQMASLYAAEGL
jgi:hypothetical protein